MSRSYGQRMKAENIKDHIGEEWRALGLGRVRIERPVRLESSERRYNYETRDYVRIKKTYAEVTQLSTGQVVNVLPRELTEPWMEHEAREARKTRRAVAREALDAQLERIGVTTGTYGWQGQHPLYLSNEMAERLTQLLAQVPTPGKDEET